MSSKVARLMTEADMLIEQKRAAEELLDDLVYQIAVIARQEAAILENLRAERIVLADIRETKHKKRPPRPHMTPKRLAIIDAVLDAVATLDTREKAFTDWKTRR